MLLFDMEQKQGLFLLLMLMLFNDWIERHNYSYFQYKEKCKYL